MLGHHSLSEFSYGDIGLAYFNYTWPVYTLYIREEMPVTGNVLSQLNETLEIDMSVVEVI
tara:strand:- start:148 stop:327 length:180 start_codon:yes stop_codon:yes gene_type:complete